MKIGRILFVWVYVLGAEKNRLIETVLLSTHNICIRCEIKKITFQYALLSGGLSVLESTFALNDNSSYTIGPIFNKLHRNVPKENLNKISWYTVFHQKTMWLIMAKGTLKIFEASDQNSK